MRTDKIDKLRVAINQFYLNKYMDQPTIPDSEYDSLVKEYSAEGGSIFNLVEWEVDVKRTHTPLPKVDKDIIDDNDLQRAVTNYIVKSALSHKYGNKFEHYLNYKYDGSSIIAYYTPEGKLHHILGTPDAEICIDRTRNCWNMFPHQVNAGIECIQGEFLVDANQYGQLARNKANGLLNSKDMIKELETEGFVRVYQMRFYDGNWSYERLMKELHELPIIHRDRIRGGTEYHDLVFSRAEMLKSIPEDSIIEEKIYYPDHDIAILSTPKFQIDGVVVYSTDGYHALKFYYTESAITTITEIEWNRQDNGSYVPKLIINGIKLNGKSIYQVASGGIQNLMYLKMGRGAQVRVILSGMTIPKVIQVLTPSEDYQWPTCSCGHKFGPDDIFGGGVKCQGNYVCSERYNMWKNRILDSFTMSGYVDRIGWFHDRIMAVLNSSLNIDRINLEKFTPTEEWINDMITCCINNNPNKMKELMGVYIYEGSTAYSILCRNYITAHQLLYDFLNNQI